MKDERIQQVLNQIKGRLLLMISITALVLISIRLIIHDDFLQNYLVEVFIIVITGIILILRLTVYKNTFDERIQKSYEKFLSIMFLIMLYGGFAIHFYIVSKESEELLSSYPFSFRFVLICSIFFVVQLINHKIYANYKWIEQPKKVYILKKIKNLAIFTFFFLFNILFYLLNGANLLIGLLTILMSLFSLGIVYLYFSLYEKNRFDEEMLIKEGQRRGISKNAGLLLIIPIIYKLINMVINFLLSRSIILYDGMNVPTDSLLFQEFINQYQLDINILILLSYLTIYSYIKLAIPKLRSILTFFKIYMIIYVIVSIYSFSMSIITPSIVHLVEFENIYWINMILVNISYGITLLFVALNTVIAIVLTFKNVKLIVLFFLHALLPLLVIIFWGWIYRLKSIEFALFTHLLTIIPFLCLYIFLRYHDSRIHTIEIM